MTNIRTLLNPWSESWWEVTIRQGIQVQYENFLNLFLLPDILKMLIVRWAGSSVILRVIRTSLKQFLPPDLKGRNNLEHISFFLLFIMAIISGACGQISSQFYYIIIRKWFRFWYRSRLIYLKPSDIPADISACWISVTYVLTAIQFYGFYISVIKILEF